MSEPAVILIVDDDQVTLRLFGKLRLSAFFEGEGMAKKSENYYRAFRLVP